MYAYDKNLSIQSIVISTGYFYISFTYIICLSMLCHHTKDHNGNKGLPFFMSVNCIFCYVCFPKPKYLRTCVVGCHVLWLKIDCTMKGKNNAKRNKMELFAKCLTRPKTISSQVKRASYCIIKPGKSAKWKKSIVFTGSIHCVLHVSLSLPLQEELAKLPARRVIELHSVQICNK